MVESALNRDIIQQLQNHKQSVRIKKLIFCVCKRYWENDGNILATFPLKYLVEELLELNPNLEKLKSSISEVVERLNRKSVYGEVAQLIINKVATFYLSYNSNFFKSFPESEINPPSSEDLLDQVAERLAHKKDTLRIKKIMVHLCNNKWINDQKLLDLFHLKDLIQETCNIYDSPGKLESALASLVHSLNRKEVYSVLANSIFNELEVLYEQHQMAKTKGQLQKKQLSNKETLVTETGFSDIKENQTQKQKQINYKGTCIVANPELEIQKALAVETFSQSKSLEYDTFTVRYEVMKYTNPLRAKIILFSLIHHRFDSSIKDWSLLNTCRLDDLLREVINKYPKIEEIEAKMLKVAKKMNSSEEYVQAAGAIFQAVKTYYN